MAAPATTAPGNNLGFLTILQEPAGTLGGYLVTNLWGRPLEFRLTSAVQPNRVQQILYGSTLATYVYAEVIGKTLVEKTATPTQAILTDSADVLHLRRLIDVPDGCPRSRAGRHPASSSATLVNPSASHSSLPTP